MSKSKILNCWRSIWIAICLNYVTISVFVEGTPIPKPQVLPGQIPTHVATHPALSSIQQGRESSLLQFAFNTANRRGPNPSPLVLQNNQERNLQLYNQYSAQRSGRPVGLTQGPPGSNPTDGSQSPELKAFLEIQKFKGQGQEQNGNYQPQALTPGNGPLNYPQQQHHHQGGAHPGAPIPGAHVHDHAHGGDENEGEDIRRLKAILNLARGGPNATPNIGVSNPGQRGVLNPGQFNPNNGPPPQAFPNNHDHSHSHGPTPFPQTAQSQNSLGSLQFGHGSPRPSGYPGPPSSSGGPSPVVHLPYNGAGAHQHAHQHGHDYHNHGQDAQTLIQSVETAQESYQNLVYIDPVREPNSINKHIEPSQSVFILPASDYTTDDYQRLLNRPAEILIDVIPKEGSKDSSGDFSLHNFSLLLTPSNYARCAQATHKKGYGGKCKLILRVGKEGGSYANRKPVEVTYIN